MPADTAPLGRSNPRVGRLRALQARRSERADQGVFVVEGRRAIETAFDAGATVEAVFVGAATGDPTGDPTGDATGDPAGGTTAALARRAEAEGVPVYRLAPGVLEWAADTVTPQGVLATVEMPHHRFDAPGELDLSLTVVLADVREPGNAGTIVRGAEAAGATAVIFCRGSADPFSPKVVRAAAGALFHVPVVQGGDAGEVVDVLAQRGVRCLGTVARGGDRYHHVDWTQPSALVLGNEAWGVPDELAASLDGWVTIPMSGRSESLNVAMAASVVLFEACRQRADDPRGS